MAKELIREILIFSFMSFGFLASLFLCVCSYAATMDDEEIGFGCVATLFFGFLGLAIGYCIYKFLWG